jgi:high-affinity nickel-transport protein
MATTDKVRRGMHMEPEVRRSLAGMAGFILLLHIVGWGVMLALVVPAHYQVQGQVVGLGLALTAYTLGMRHAFDADHIAAIDNTTRKLMTSGQRPMSVGFWFSLGHSSVVFVMVTLLSIGLAALSNGITDSQSELQQVTSLWGTAISGLFLMLIAAINLVSLLAILRVFSATRRGQHDAAKLDEHLDNRGLLNRVLGRATKGVNRPWHMYPVGVLFGLGFDTVTEIGLLVIAGGASAASMPWWAVMTLPVLFAAGMTLLDSIDGSFMNFAYGWAFSNPIRKIYYNIVITALSVAVAMLIGGIELISLMAEKLDITEGPLAAVASVDLNTAGFWIVGMFAVTWLVAVAVWRIGKLEDRWSPEAVSAADAARISLSARWCSVCGSAEFRFQGGH